MKDFNVHVSRQAIIHSSRIFISYFHLSRKLKALNPVSRNNPFHPLLQRFFCVFIYLFILSLTSAIPSGTGAFSRLCSGTGSGTNLSVE